MQWERRTSACDSGQQPCVTPCLTTGWKRSCQTHGPNQNYHYPAWDKSKITIPLPRKQNFIRYIRRGTTSTEYLVHSGATGCILTLLSYLLKQQRIYASFSMSCLDTRRLRSAGFVGPACFLCSSPKFLAGDWQAENTAVLPGLCPYQWKLGKLQFVAWLSWLNN